MGPAILLCPPSTTAQWLSYGSPSKATLRQRESTVCFAGSFVKKPSFYSRKTYRKRNVDYPFTWNRVFASGEEAITVEEPTIDTSEAGQVEQEVGGEEAEVVSSSSSSASVTADSSTVEEVSVSEEPKVRGKRNLSRSGKKALVVSNEELVPGAIFSGKVSTIQTFGAFVDLGAFTNGLVHISKLSKGFVKKVEDVVQIGQEVNVKIVDVDFNAKRISLMLMAEDGKEEEEQQQRDEGKEGENNPQRGSPSSPSSSAPSSTRRRTRNPSTSTKMKKGETATGIVKNMIRSGVFLTLPDGTDGYLPAGEVVFRGPNTSLENHFQIGQEVTVRVLRIERGRVTLTTKQEVNFDKINEDLNKGVAERATNPFELAFRRNESISSFLAERKKQEESNSENQEIVDTINGTISTKSDTEKMDEITPGGVISKDISEKENNLEDDKADASTDIVESVDAISEEGEDEEEEEKTETLAERQEIEA